MVNASAPDSNATRISVYSSDQPADLFYLWFGLLLLTVLCFILFLWFFKEILKVYFTTPHVRENARYVLFAHMLINDTLYITVGLLFCMCSLFKVNMPVTACFVLLSFSGSTFRITPYNLAAMALERYIAICYPLMHVTICRPHRSYVVIAVIWVVGFMPNVADIAFLRASVDSVFFSLNMICKQEIIIVNLIQASLRSIIFIASLTLVGLVIIFTYIKVMLVARQIGSGSSSASKAGKTVMLHAFQLLLCMMSLTHSIVEANAEKNVFFIKLMNFLLFMCLPRFLSPLIYGIRDEVFSRSIRNMYSAKCVSK